MPRNVFKMIYFGMSPGNMAHKQYHVVRGGEKKERLWIKTYLNKIVALWPWANHLGFFNSRIRVIISTPQCSFQDQVIMGCRVSCLIHLGFFYLMFFTTPLLCAYLRPPRENAVHEVSWRSVVVFIWEKRPKSFKSNFLYSVLYHVYLFWTSVFFILIFVLFFKLICF